MSHVVHTPSNMPATKVSRLTAAVRRNWSQARHTDRQLMVMRTNLIRHVG
jgi:hypothetical protein